MLKTKDNLLYILTEEPMMLCWRYKTKGIIADCCHQITNWHIQSAIIVVLQYTCTQYVHTCFDI